MVVSAPSAAAKQNANLEYQKGRTAFEKGDFATAEPHFLKAAKHAPEFPEPHFALAQIMVRMGRHAEAQSRMAMAQKNMPAVAATPAAAAGTPAGDAALAAAAAAAAAGLQQQGAGTDAAPSIAQLDAMASKAAVALPAMYTSVGRALSKIAIHLVEARSSIDRMAASSDAQDVHNARIHRVQYTAAEVLFARLAQSAPTDANLWWQLSLNSFNLRRDYTTAAVAFGVTAALSSAQMVVMSYYLLYHAWQHLCDWRDWDVRLRILAERLHSSLGDTRMLAAGAGGPAQWESSGSSSSSVGSGSSSSGSGDSGSGDSGSDDSGSSGSGSTSSSNSLVASADGSDSSSANVSELESLVMAMEAPYILLVSRLVDFDPTV